MKHLCVFGYVRILKYPTSKQISQYSQYFVFIFSFARGENNIQQNLSSTFLSLSSNKTKFKGGKKESHRPGPSGTECGQVALLKFFKSNEIWDNKSQIYTKIKGGGQYRGSNFCSNGPKSPYCPMFHLLCVVRAFLSI